jgi:UDP-N-acetylglucosamine--N-acetylmuramyl-(pentapeptide) pyrophosphoryl-undecaprenol N-acetylglucosamine transferase
VLLVAGGSQGARSINELAVRTFAAEGAAVLHLAGVRDYEELRPRVARPDYRLLPYTSDYGLALGAARVCLAFPLPGRDSPRYLVTGRAVPPTYEDRASARAAFHLAADDVCVLVFGGSLGARSINEAAPQAFANAPYRVVHVAGTRDYAALTAPGPHYILLDYLSPFGVALAAADVAVARSGGSVFELAAAGLPAILVPYPHATGDHQTKNARYFAAAGGAVLVPDAELERVPVLVRDLLADHDLRSSMSEAMRRVARPDAADEIAEELIELASARR